VFCSNVSIFSIPSCMVDEKGIENITTTLEHGDRNVRDLFHPRKWLCAAKTGLCNERVASAFDRYSSCIDRWLGFRCFLRRSWMDPPHVYDRLSYRASHPRRSTNSFCLQIISFIFGDIEEVGIGIQWRGAQGWATRLRQVGSTRMKCTSIVGYRKGQ